ncbi:HIT domain-containing protein [Persicimonas caeni]|uniref:HIT domain-containing protein n=1 Tax=Persicimonas caeni TaxID=2292766 RepID=A0A4Y6PVF0_PERCE|nr:DEAD/DEAH box helicase family protein [Persicimonas caeni]QDG52099.1 HIT domain-containing protein [Persicimonas caeni]QED33320.1 HIT domain-containing protein [Persicimonas caeni]
MSSPFTQIPQSAWLASNDLAFAFFDGYPVTDGHTLIVPHRVVPTWFDATVEEQQAIMQLVDEVKAVLDARFEPDGYNIGINAGEAAGQTVMHLHVHVIPRYKGDMPDPRGGVRHVIPWKGNYLAESSPSLATGGADDHFVDHLRPLFARAQRIAIVAAFVQDSGLQLLQSPLRSALDRGVDVRLLTGDYFNITQVEALKRLLDWMDGAAAVREQAAREGSLEVRVVEVGKRDGWPKSFHPKSWRFESPSFGVAFVGSSNISHTALTVGSEWNLRVRRQSDPQGYGEVVRAFDAQWDEATPLTLDWVSGYELRARAKPKPLPTGEEDEEAPAEVPTPHDVQAEALEALEKARKNGRERALVVHATGLGKTWLAAFDVRAFADYFHTSPRVLFVAHRAEILQQAADTFRRILPEATFGWYVGSRSQAHGDVVFASVQKLTYGDNLAALKPDAFDYIIVDEVHHAAAPSYRRILEHLDPAFLLGLTATPDRADEADIRPLFDDFVAHRASIGEGIELEFLSPFHYFGLADVTDYAPIPWRNGKFQTEALTKAVATHERMARVWEALAEHPGESTIIFCSSIDHARFVSEWLAERDMQVAAIFSGPDSADRDASLRALKDGELDAVCAVDILNEGVDIPRVDRVVMLRPTESPVVFMQQLGRGLRTADGKDYLTVLDFVGNHRVFLDRVRTLLSLGPKPLSLRKFLEKGEQPELPKGCQINIELEAIDLLKDLLPTSSRSSLVREYRELHQARGKRPTASELHTLGFNLRTLKKHGGWFGFLADEGDLTDAELEAWRVGEAWFHELETTTLNKSYKMVVVQALLDADALDTGLPIDAVSDRCHRILARSPELFQDIASLTQLDDPRDPDSEQWRNFWDAMPLSVWSGDYRRTIDNPWFTRTTNKPTITSPRGTSGEDQGGASSRSGNEPRYFTSHVPVPSAPAAREAFLTMTRELVEYRLTKYRERYDEAAQETGAFRAKLISNKRDPILKLPSRKKHPDIPRGETTVALPDGQKWRFRFVKIAVNVAHPVGANKNRLPDLLRTWFGPAAGEPGTEFRVEFRPTKDGWRIEPLGAHVIPFPRPGHVIAFPNLQAAAGAHRLPQDETPTWTQLRLADADAPSADFAVQAHGDSMDGGDVADERIRNGDWVLMRWARGEPLEAVEGRVALVRHAGESDEAPAYYLKRVVETEEGFELRSDNPRVPALEASEETVVVALCVGVTPRHEATSRHMDAFVAALPAQLERHGVTREPAYAAALEEEARRLAEDAADRSEFIALLSDWMVAEYEVDEAFSSALLDRIWQQTQRD